jgi:conjugation system TraG family ATPase
MGERLSKYFPVEDILEGCLVNGLFDVTAGFAMQWPEVYTLSSEDYTNIHQGLVSIISRLPAGCVVHYQGYFFDTVYKGSYSGSSDIQKANFRYYHERPVLKNYSNLFVTFQHSSRASKYSGSPLARGWDWIGGKRTAGIDKVIDNYRKYFAPFESDLNLIHRVKAKRLTDENLLCSLYNYFNLTYDSPAMDAAQAVRGIQDIEINIDKGYTRVGNEFLSVVTLTKEGGYLVSSQDKANAKLPTNASQVKLPQSINLHTSMPFLLGIGLPFNHIVNVGIEVLDNEQASSSLSGMNDIGTNILAGVGQREAVSKQKEKEQFLDSLASNSYRACRTKVNVIVNDPSHDKLQEKLNYVKNAFIRMNDSTVFFENEHSANLFISSAPGAMKFLYREPILQTVDQAVCYLPKESQYFSDKDGIVFVDRFGAPVLLNMWNSPHIVNRNKVVFGPSGTGKSVLINHLTTQNLANGHHVIIIDIGGSYKKNCDFHEGFYFDASDKQNLSFNVFICAQDDDGNYRYSESDEDGEGAEDQVNYVYSVLRKLWRGNDKVSNDEKNIVKDSIREFYEYVNTERIFPTLMSYYPFLNVYEKDIMKPEYKGFINLNSLRLALEPYVTGEYKYLLNSERNILLQHERFIVFDLEGIKNNEDLSGIVMTIVMGIATSKIERTHGVRKTLIIDEAIDFLKGDAADFIGGSYRKIRKRDGEVILATQGVGYLDEIDPLTRKSIIGNSDTVILLSHKNDKNSIPLLRKYFLNEHELDLLDSMENGDRYREVFIKMGSFAKVYRTEISYFAEGVYTTTKTELEEIYRLEKEIGNLGAAINQFVYNKYVKNS